MYLYTCLFIMFAFDLIFFFNLSNEKYFQNIDLYIYLGTILVKLCIYNNLYLNNIKLIITLSRFNISLTSVQP